MTETTQNPAQSQRSGTIHAGPVALDSKAICRCERFWSASLRSRRAPGGRRVNRFCTAISSALHE
jgi:hypothetical protein